MENGPNPKFPLKAKIGHGPQNGLGKAEPRLGLLRLRLGIRPFRPAPWRNHRPNDENFYGEEGQRI